MTAEIDLLTHELREARGDGGAVGDGGAREDAAGALVLLHGRGADERDLLPLLDALDPDRRLAGVTARAPLALPPGGWHWYMSVRPGFPDPDTFWQSYQLLERWLAAVPGLTGVPFDRTVLGGFSMGAVMSYALGLGRGRPAPAGVLALSGFVPAVDGFSLELGEHARASPRAFRVAIGHGTEDPVIPVDFARAARRQLEAAGAEILYRESPMPHTIDPEFVRVLEQWVGDTLDAASEEARE